MYLFESTVLLFCCVCVFVLSVTRQGEGMECSDGTVLAYSDARGSHYLAQFSPVGKCARHRQRTIRLSLGLQCEEPSPSSAVYHTVLHKRLLNAFSYCSAVCGVGLFSSSRECVRRKYKNSKSSCKTKCAHIQQLLINLK